MKGLSLAIHKDIRECVRRKKMLIFCLSALGVGLLVYVASMVLPVALENLLFLAPELLPGKDALSEVMSTFFPGDVRSSLALLSSNLLTFYIIVMVIVSQNLLTSEFRKGRWDMPRANGYTSACLALSKCIVYSVAGSLPVFVVYILYYWAVSLSLVRNLSLGQALGHALINMLCTAAVMCITLFGSMVFKHSVVNVISVLGIILFVPDILYFFSFSEYLPTYPFSFAKSVLLDFGSVIMPMVILILICALFGVLGIYKYQKRLKKSEFGERND